MVFASANTNDKKETKLLNALTQNTYIGTIHKLSILRYFVMACLP